MDKVIIDGVDVSGCNNIDEWEHCNICQVLIKTVPNRHQCLTEGDLRCEFYPDCYYKQLKRKEQECEKWEKLANEANERANDYANDIGKLQEDVRYYKELSKDFDTKLKLAHQDFTDFIQKQKLEISELKAECEKLKSWLDKAEQEQKKFIDKNRELKQQVKTLKYMLFEEKEMSKNEYTLKYKLADKERRWTQYKHLTKGKLDNYRQALQEIRGIAEKMYNTNDEDIERDFYIKLQDKINEVIGAE